MNKGVTPGERLQRVMVAVVSFWCSLGVLFAFPALACTTAL